MNPLKALLLAVSICTPALAQISYTTDSATVSENFTNTALSTTWTNNITFANWYASYLNAGAYTTPTVLTQSPGNQASTSNSLYMWRPASNTADGALGGWPIGAQTSLNTGGVYIGTQIANATGSTLTSFTLGYTGEQWHLSSGPVSTFVVSYSLDATSLTNGTWTTITDATFTSPFSAGASTDLDGNAAANRSVISATVTGISLLSGQNIWIRWYDMNVNLVDQGIGIDDVTFSATSVASPVPEPSTYAALAGAIGLIAAIGMRRRSKKLAA